MCCLKPHRHILHLQTKDANEASLPVCSWQARVVWDHFLYINGFLAILSEIS